MTGHFDKNLNLRQIILDRRPELIVECGAGNGDCTKLLAHLKWFYDFDLVSITDKKLEGEWIQEVDWRIGLSYEELAKFDPGSIGLLIIDTDHNYWTLTQELLAARDKMKEGGLIVMHDVQTFYYDTGMAMRYWGDKKYPESEIKEYIRWGGLGCALLDFLHSFRGDFKLTHWTPEHHGCAVIEKVVIKETRLVMPGSDPLFAPKP